MTIVPCVVTIPVSRFDVVRHSRYRHFTPPNSGYTNKYNTNILCIGIKHTTMNVEANLLELINS